MYDFALARNQFRYPSETIATFSQRSTKLPTSPPKAPDLSLFLIFVLNSDQKNHSLENSEAFIIREFSPFAVP